MHEFPVDTPIAVDVRMAAGQCTVVAEERDTATVEVEPMQAGDERAQQIAAETTVEFAGDSLLVKAPDANGIQWLFGGRRNARLRVTIHVPQGSSLSSTAASSDLVCTGRLGTTSGRDNGLSINTASGNAQVEYVAGNAALNTASGDLRIGHIEGGVKANSASGDLRIEHVGAGLTQNSASGDITLGTTSGDVKVHSASGDITIGAARSGKVEISSASGDVAIGVPAGTGVWLDLKTASGTTTSDLSVGGGAPLSGHDLELRVSTASGDIDVNRVSGA